MDEMKTVRENLLAIIVIEEEFLNGVNVLSTAPRYYLL